MTTSPQEPQAESLNTPETPQSFGPSPDVSGQPEPVRPSQPSQPNLARQEQPTHPQGQQGQQASWHRPWETSRDRSSFAIGFSTSMVNDVFVELSRTFMLALRLDIVENPPAHSSEATIRPSDLYFLHMIMRGCHDALLRVIGLLSTDQRALVQQLVWLSTAQVALLLLMVHVAFVCPYTQMDSTLRLSRLVAQEGGWESFRCHSSMENLTAHAVGSPTIVRVELLETWWARQPAAADLVNMRPIANHTPGAEMENLSMSNDTTTGSGNSTEDSSDLSTNVLRRLSSLVYFGYDAAFPRPTYEVTVGPTAPWLDVKSTAFRNLGVQTKHVRVSVEDPKYFGVYLSRSLLSSLGLHDMYMLHALPRHFLTDSNNEICGTDFRPFLHVRTVSSKQTVSLESVESRMAAGRRGWNVVTFFSNLLNSMLFLSGLCIGAVVFSAFLRRVLVLSCRMYIYNMLCLRQMRRFAFIAEQMRRVNRAPSTVLLELWVAWAVCAGILLWILVEALQRSFVWFLWIICYALAEFWGLAHVRTTQSRWLFPRSMLLIHAGAAAYAFWWPLGPLWLVLASLIWAQACIMFTLISDLDCCFALPSEPPNEVLAASLLLPAVPLSRASPKPWKEENVQGSEHSDSASQSSSEANVE